MLIILMSLVLSIVIVVSTIFIADFIVMLINMKKLKKGEQFKFRFINLYLWNTGKRIIFFRTPQVKRNYELEDLIVKTKVDIYKKLKKYSFLDWEVFIQIKIFEIHKSIVHHPNAVAYIIGEHPFIFLNPTFKSLSKEEKIYTLCHECLHVLFVQSNKEESIGFHELVAYHYANEIVFLPYYSYMKFEAQTILYEYLTDVFDEKSFLKSICINDINGFLEKYLTKKDVEELLELIDKFYITVLYREDYTELMKSIKDIIKRSEKTKQLKLIK